MSVESASRAVKESDAVGPEIIHDAELIDALVSNAEKATKKFRSYTQKQVDEIVRSVTTKILPHAMEIAEQVQEETRFGFLEDKYFKIRAVIEVNHNYLRGKKSVGVINQNKDGIIEIAEPVGVIAGILNSTGTGAIDYVKIINTLKTRNSIVLAPHPRTKKVAYKVANLLHKFAIEAGAPEGCIQCIETPSVPGTNYLMKHPKIKLIWATGGSGMVKAAYSSGKPTLGVGPGNTPVYIDSDVDADFAAESILISKVFDGATACTCESNLFVHQEIKPQLLKSFEKYGYYVLTNDQKELLEKYMYPEKDGHKHFNAEIVGMPVEFVCEQAGIKPPEGTKVLVVEMSNEEVGHAHPVSREKLSNVLTMYTVSSAVQGLAMAIDNLEIVGKGHTAVVHSHNKGVCEMFAEAIPVSRIIANGPSTNSAVFDTYNKRIPTYSVGCGRMGGNSTTGNISYLDLLDIKTYSERMDENRWYIIPREIYKDEEAIGYLSRLTNKKIFAVIDPGISKMVEEKLNQCLDSSNKLCISNHVEPDPSFEIVEEGYKLLKDFHPDTIIVIGGGSAIDAAKGMYIRYEYPEIDIRTLGIPFYDIFDQIAYLPPREKKSKFIAAPTTCGTGSEVTPFAVFTDKGQNRKFVVGSYEITPDVTILLSEMIHGLPKHILADTVFDALSHAIEAYVSVKDCAEADVNSINAVRLIFENLPKAFLENDKEAKSNLLVAACEAGKAISNAYLGINHSLSHQLGGQFHIPHGKANAILMVPVIKFNSQPVRNAFRITPYPNNKVFNSKARYSKLARKSLHIYANTDKEIVNKFCEKIDELRNIVGIEGKISEIINFKYSKEEYEKLIPLMAKNALQDLCTGCNPIYPSLKDFETIYKECFE